MFKFLSTSKSLFSRCSWLAISSFSLVSLGSLAARPAQAAILNGSFETNPNNLNGWMTTGDVSIVGTFNDFDPTDGLFQALLTTATAMRDDDNIGLGAYRFSDTDATFATVNDPELQNFLGLSPTALQVPGALFTQDSKEGSAIKQSFSSAVDFELSFDWRFLTNDGEISLLPFAPPDPRDRAIVTIDDGTNITILNLDQSTGLFPVPGSLVAPEFFKNSEGIFSIDLAAGNYTVGIAVYDVAGTDKTSALLVDNVTVESSDDPQPVPEPLSTLGLLAVGACIACGKKRQQNTQTSKQ
ncbi:MAG: hypothetical protein F6K18_05790 [Okeania sp. SIO2C2]|uniref:hypothetical protein n=1 Tax=Okeania sp. SIO2C2 TaxID=2607787 RepID=UPI0013B84B21|nr:hypothetical protein [Okeania sp. SIO2C2]NEP86371.1 hypothetical protein [Okeania sp. SIO2C2]